MRNYSLLAALLITGCNVFADDNLPKLRMNEEVQAVSAEIIPEEEPGFLQQK